MCVCVSVCIPSVITASAPVRRTWLIPINFHPLHFQFDVICFLLWYIVPTFHVPTLYLVLLFLRTVAGWRSDVPCCAGHVLPSEAYCLWRQAFPSRCCLTIFIMCITMIYLAKKEWDSCICFSLPQSSTNERKNALPISCWRHQGEWWLEFISATALLPAVSVYPSRGGPKGTKRQWCSRVTTVVTPQVSNLPIFNLHHRM